MKHLVVKFLRFLSPSLPPLDDYEIEVRPRHNVKVSEARSTNHKVHNGKSVVEKIEADGILTTEYGKQKPRTSGDVKLDKFDMALLDFVIGIKWRKDEARAAIMKWHWMKEDSAKQIETLHTDTQTNELERGYSERTAADYIKAFFEADDERSKQNVPRLRPPREAKIVQW